MNNNVLEFINNFMDHAGIDEEPLKEVIGDKFSYQFAAMLQNVFKTGRILWAAPFGYFVYADSENNVYDIDGIYKGESSWFIPTSYIDHKVLTNNFIYFKDQIYVDKSEILSWIKKYFNDYNLDFDYQIEEILEISDMSGFNEGW